MHVHTLLTHEYPDLDSLVGCWLLRRYGEATFPGVSQAGIEFRPASTRGVESGGAQLEREGILLVDLGGGRFGGHLSGGVSGDEPVLESCATSLIARTLGLERRPGLQELVEFVRLQDTRGRSITSRHPEDHALALVSILRGLHLRNGPDFLRTYHELEPLLVAIVEVQVPAAEVLAWYLQERPCTFELDGQEHLAANPFDGVLASWIARRQEHTSWSPVGPDDLAREGLASRCLLRQSPEEPGPEFQKLLTYAALPRVTSARPHLSEMDFRVSGLHLVYGMVQQEGSLPAAARALTPCLEGVLAVEDDWHRSLEELSGCIRIVRAGPRGRRVRICAFESSRVSMTRAVRYKHHPDLCIHRDPALQAVGLTLVQYRGPLRDFTFDGRGGVPGEPGDGQPRQDSVAARVRLAESLISGEPLEQAAINDAGMVGGWYLHQSLRILAKGSRKAPDVPPTRIPWPTLVDLVATTFDPSRRLPALWCSPERCPCPFAALELPNCREREQSSGLSQ